nr:transposase, MuDR, MULE transposase domain protein [Tanacetum cinerariifolium]
MSEDLTYSMLHEMMMKKFNLESNYRLNLSVKLSSFDYTFDITDDVEIHTFLNYLRPLLIIDATHLKGLYKGTNLVDVGMDGNTQIVPISFGICKGETGPCWSWWMSVLKECIANMTYEITDWVANNVTKKRMKNTTWVVNGVNHYQYQVSDGQYTREVNLQIGTCECRKWQLSGIPYGHVIAVTRNMKQWEFSHNIQKAIPSRMDNPRPGRPKNTNRTQSQGDEPRLIHSGRCKQARHRRDQCNKAFVAELPVNIRRRHDQEILRNNKPSFYNPRQQYDNTFQTYNQYSSQQYGETTYPSQPYGETTYLSQSYEQCHTNASQTYDGHHTESALMYEQYDSQQYASHHLDDLNMNVAGKLQIFVSRNLIDLSTVLIPNDGSLEESFAATNPNDFRLTVLMALQEAHDEEACLEEQMLSLMHRFADRFTNRRPEINRLMTLPDHPLIEYGRYALGCMTGADMKKLHT